MPLITDNRDEFEKYILASERAGAKRLTEKVLEFRKAMIEAKHKLPKNDKSGLHAQIQAIAAQESDPSVKPILNEIVQKIIHPEAKPSIHGLLNSGMC